jgi:hypothetical protein
MKTHDAWAVTLPCKVIQLSGEVDLYENVNKIVNEYYEEINKK